MMSNDDDVTLFSGTKLVSILSRSRTLPSFSISAADSLRKFHVHVPFSCVVVFFFRFRPWYHRTIVVCQRIPFRSDLLYQSYSLLFSSHSQSSANDTPSSREAIIASNKIQSNYHGKLSSTNYCMLTFYSILFISLIIHSFFQFHAIVNLRPSASSRTHCSIPCGSFRTRH